MLCAAGSARGQDWNALRDQGPLDPSANLVPTTLPQGVAVPRVLLAGDSWAQYMWDDGSHNDIFDRYGHAEKLAVSQSLSSDPGPGYTGTQYAVSGSEARQWVDVANYPWIANMVAALTVNPTIDRVLLSIDGNDVLAGKSGGGWYKDMNLDHPGSETALFARIHDDTFTIINAALAVRPDLRVVLSSYDYPNFNTGILCFVYACPKRQDLSRDPVNALITDPQLNGMMVTVETQRIGWTLGATRVDYDNSVGLMHYFYGDGVAGPLVLPRPGTLPPDYNPFPGGNPLRPTLRSNFRNTADPIHLSIQGYQYKIVQETEALFLPHFREGVLETFFSRGGLEDGWTDGTVLGTSGIQIGDTGPALARGIISFDTSALPDNAIVTRARFHLTRTSLVGTNPFTTGGLGLPRVDVISGSFGAPAVEVSDASAPADAENAGFAAGSAKSNGYAVGVEIDAAGREAINPTGLTQFRLSMTVPGGGTGTDAVTFADGDATAPPSGFPTLAAYMGTSAPFLDVSYRLPTAVGDDVAAIPGPRLLPSSPNPFRSSTSLRFYLNAPEPVRLRIVDVQGRLVATLLEERLDAGGHTVAWTGRDDHGRTMPAGVYLAVLETGSTRSSLRVVRMP
jgi:hypothetical protein